MEHFGMVFHVMSQEYNSSLGLKVEKAEKKKKTFCLGFKNKMYVYGMIWVDVSQTEILPSESLILSVISPSAEGM